MRRTGIADGFLPLPATRASRTRPRRRDMAEHRAFGIGLRNALVLSVTFWLLAFAAFIR